MKQPSSPSVPYDPISLEIMWGKLTSIVDEAAAALVRSSFSTIVRESNDYCCGLLDAEARSLAESSYSIPLFMGTLSRTVQHFLAQFPAEDWRPGDVVITNDPWMGTGHLPDITLAIPVFLDDQLVAFAANVAHAPDIGGIIWSADSRDVFEEGLAIPPMRLFEEGERNEHLFRMIEANVRVPDQVIGDLYAQVASAETCRQHLLDFLESSTTGVNLKALGNAIQGRAEAAVRGAIAKLPDGTYCYEITADGLDTPLSIACGLTVAGDTIEVDYSGTSEQATRGINCVWNVTNAYTAYAIKCVLDPETPKNEGSYLPIIVRAPEGTLLNPVFPAPVNARGLIAQYIPAVVYGALAQVIPERVIAESGSPATRFVFAGHAADGSRFSQIFLPWGGMGARPTKDGISVIAFPSNSGVGSMEIVEALTPLVVWRKSLIPDSGGAGKFRGGLGQEFVIEVGGENEVQLSVLGERMQHPPEGFFGGRPGGLAGAALQSGRPVDPKGRTQVRPGDVLTFRYAGGGGYGDPTERDASAVEDDLKNGLVTEKTARDVYGHGQ